MKLNRILAGMSAAAMAASMLTMVTASAADSSTLKVQLQAVGWSEYSNTTAITADGDYSITVGDLSIADGLTNLGFFAVGADEKAVTATVNSIVVNNDYTVTVGSAVNTADETGNGLPNIWNPAGQADVVFSGDGCSFKGDGGTSIKFYVGDTDTAITSVTYNITVSGYSEGGSDSETDSGYPADAIFANGGSKWGDAGDFDSFKEVDFLEWEGTTFQIDYGKEGYNFDDSNAKLVLKITTPAEVEAGTLLFRLAETTDETTHTYTAPEAGSSFTFEIPYSEFKEFQDSMGYGVVNYWDNGFNTNFQAATAANVSIYMSGVTYTPVEESEGDGSSEAPVPATSYVAFEMFTDADYGWGNWLPNGVENEDGTDIGKGTDAEITGNGTYTVSVSAEQVAAWYDAEGNAVVAGTEGATPAPAAGVNVWCVDILKLADALGVGSADLGKDVTNADKMQLVKDAGVTFSDVSLIVDGETIYTYNDEDLLYADIEGNGNLRLEIYNTYGDTKTTAPAEVAALAPKEGGLVAEDEIAVTFTINGLPEELPEPTESSEPSKDSSKDKDSTAASKTDSTTSSKNDNKGNDKNPSTGAAALATVGVLLAGAAVVATKKK